MLKNSDKATNIYAIVPAAGSGERFGGAIPKQYLPLNGQTVIERSIKTLLQVVDTLVLAIAEDDQYWADLPLAQDSRIRVVMGGSSRAESVQNALNSLVDVDPDDWVLIHDAVRPLVAEIDIRKLIETLQHHPSGGLLASPIYDTVKRADKEGQVVKTENRDGLWVAQTPQLFRYAKLQEVVAGAASDAAITDEALAMENAGHGVQLVEGSRNNIKITRSADLVFAQQLIRAQTVSHTVDTNTADRAMDQSGKPL